MHAINLQRFVDAQAGIYEQALHELRAGQKQSHWMWFVFPQLDGLGTSSMSRHYAIKSLAEARTYLDHPLLGMRLRECTQAVLGLDGPTAHDIFGSPDDLKFRSCMTLFEKAATHHSVFSEALARYFSDHRDTRTLRLLTHSHDKRPHA